LPVGTHDWARVRTPAEMAKAIEASGLVVRDVAGIVFRPEALKPLASPLAWGIDQQDTDVNYIMVATRPFEA
jgi:2-polyprenyl-3-methyl-5-hydroxy-6-metoxy-1,4-benzoquinol methylase